MPIADAAAHRVLDYIGRVCEVGYSPTLRQVQAYARNPFRAAWMKIASGEFLQTDLVDWLHDNEWIDIDESERVSLTELGQCALRALRRAQGQAPADSIVVFREGGPFNYAEFLTRLAEYGEFMLVDPYFRELEHLEDILKRTQCSRILISTKLKKPQRDGLVLALREPIASHLEIREVPEVHDRFVIPESGGVATLGTSLTGLDKHFSVMCKLEDPFGEMIRRWHRTKWSEATSLCEHRT